MVTTCAADRDGSSSGCGECATSNSPPASASTGGHRAGATRGSAARTGMRRSTTRTPGQSRRRSAGARSFHELENSGDVVAARSREARGDLMDVFADAGAGPEGRTVVDDDPHAAEPITTRRISLLVNGLEAYYFMLKSPDLSRCFDRPAHSRSSTEHHE